MKLSLSKNTSDSWAHSQRCAAMPGHQTLCATMTPKRFRLHRAEWGLRCCAQGWDGAGAASLSPVCGDGDLSQQLDAGWKQGKE